MRGVVDVLALVGARRRVERNAVFNVFCIAWRLFDLATDEACMDVNHRHGAHCPIDLEKTNIYNLLIPRISSLMRCVHRIWGILSLLHDSHNAM